LGLRSTHHTYRHEERHRVVDLVGAAFFIRRNVHIFIVARNDIARAPVEHRIAAVPQVAGEVKPLTLLYRRVERFTALPKLFENRARLGLPRLERSHGQPEREPIHQVADVPTVVRENLRLKPLADTYDVIFDDGVVKDSARKLRDQPRANPSRIGYRPAFSALHYRLNWHPTPAPRIYNPVNSPDQAES